MNWTMNNRFVQQLFRLCSKPQFRKIPLFKGIASATCVAATLSIAIPAQAEQRSYTCHYTEASYTAPFSKTPSIRQCPEGECAYQVHIDNDSATINGISGFSVTKNNDSITLQRSAKDPVMGGLDTTEFVLNTVDLHFISTKTTTPAVILTTAGSCQ